MKQKIIEKHNPFEKERNELLETMNQKDSMNKWSIVELEAKLKALNAEKKNSSNTEPKLSLKKSENLSLVKEEVEKESESCKEASKQVTEENEKLAATSTKQSKLIESLKDQSMTWREKGI